MTVQVLHTIRTQVAKRNAGRASHFIVDIFQAGQDGVKGHLIREAEVEVLRKPIVTKVAALERRSSLEHQLFAKPGARQADEEPGQTIIALQDSFRNAPPAGASKPVR